MQSCLFGFGFFLFGLSGCLLLAGVFLLDVLQFLQALLGDGECSGGQLLGLEVEVSQRLLGLVLLSAQEDDVGEFLGALLALCVHGLQHWHEGLEAFLHCLEIGGFLCDIGLVHCFVLFAGRVSLGLEVVLVPQKCLNDGAKLGQFFLKVLVDIPVGFDLPVLVSVVNHFLGLGGVVSLGVDGGHGVGNSAAAGGDYFCESGVVGGRRGVELPLEFFLALGELCSEGLLILHLMFKSI